MFIGRTKEITILEDLYGRKTAQLVVMYGKRRMGKSEILRKFTEGKDSMYYSCADGNCALQLDLFARKMGTSPFGNWKDAFEFVGNTSVPSIQKVIIFDEFQRIMRNDGSVVDSFKDVWDSVFSKSNTLVILCGSSIPYMMDGLLSKESPLFGRVTRSIEVGELGFKEASELVPNMSSADKIRTYAAFGGVPKYLVSVKNDRVAEASIFSKCVSSDGMFYDEPDRIIRREFRDPATYNTIMYAIASGCTRPTDIAKTVGIDRTGLTQYISNLMKTGFVSKTEARGGYTIENNFLRFWYACVFPNISDIESGSEKTVKPYFKNILNEFATETFEKVCKEYLIKNGEFKTISDCIFSDKPASLEDLKNKDLDSNSILFSVSGFSEDVVEIANESGTCLVSLEMILA